MARMDKQSGVPDEKVSGNMRINGDTGNSMQALVSGMEQEAQQEAEKITVEARKEAERKILYAERQVESILNEAASRAEAQAEKIRQQALSGVAVEAKRRSMNIQEDMNREILHRAVSKLEMLADIDGYREVMIGYIVEAAVGLDVSAARVNATEHDRKMITKALLGEAERKVKKVTGKNVRLTLSEEPPLSKQGVVLTSEDNRTAYDNRIYTRLMRKAVEIRQYIHERLFGD
jgi:vacuolar-type H+-ATPase subunit E/Vma4